MKLRHSAESPCFLEKYIGSIMYGNCHHNTSNPYDKNITIHKSDYNQLVRVKPAGC